MTRADGERARWERVQELLDALDGISAAEHEAYLAQVCSDPEMRREVLALRAAEGESQGYLDGFAERLGREPDRAASRDLSGREIGAYRLSRPLGRGGMGVVYEAERADGAFEQRVALKLLTVALTGTEAHDRFLAERRILAGLEHPAIARIVDGGVSDDGTPWFAMEYVEGEAIDAYCDRRRLGVRERLELFLQVCDAVEHAHHRLVIHRDLKPANVLVTEGQVKLLDFGIAKLLEVEGATQMAPATRTALRLMTPEYASPEQVRGEAVTTATDVYQLGVLLYELLTGHRPYVLRHRGAGELERVVCEQPPTRLSAAIAREDTLKPSDGVAASTVEGVSRARRSSPARLRRRLRGDLDNIVLKALSKEPERRYGSADRLAQDIRRHLDGQTVTARSDTWLYRGRKFLARHAVGATASALLLVVAAGLVGFYTARIQIERDRAQAEAAKAEQVSQFLTGLFRSADPSEARGAELTARELLDRGVEQVERELSGQPTNQADMLQVLGSTYREVGLYDSAEDLLRRSLELRRSRPGVDPRGVASALGDLGELRRRQGEYERARKHLEEAVRVLETSVGADAPELADVLWQLGATFRRLGEHEKGRLALERALTIQSRASGPDSLPVADILHPLSSLAAETGAPERAEGYLERVLAVRERELGADHPRVGNTLVDLASIRAMQGKREGLEALYRRGLAIQEKAYGPSHDRVGRSLSNLGSFLAESGRYEEAIDVLRRALDIQVTAVGPDHPAVVYTLVSLGDAHLVTGGLRVARDYFQQSANAQETAMGADSFDFLLFYSLVRLGRVELELEREAAAELILNRALAIWRQAPEAVSSQLAPVLLDLGRWLTEQQRCGEAVPLLRSAAQIHATRQGPPTSQMTDLENLLADCTA